MQEIYKAVRLGNNMLTSCDFLHSAFLAQKLNPLNILWLDLSFNMITTISEQFLAQFPNLTTLYLHANKITRLTDLRKLSALPKLKSVTVYGNPVEEKKQYRSMLIYSCSNITQIDFCTITQRQRDQVSCKLYRKHQ